MLVSFGFCKNKTCVETLVFSVFDLNSVTLFVVWQYRKLFQPEGLAKKPLWEQDSPELVGARMQVEGGVWPGAVVACGSEILEP